MKTSVLTFFVSVLVLIALGMVMLVSASTGQVEARYLIMQPIWCVVGLLACLLAGCGDYRWLKKSPWIPLGLLAVTVVLLALVLVPGIGIRVKGATRWIGYGGVRMQPSEIAKIIVILVLAWYGERYQRYMPTFWRGVALPALLFAPVLGLIFKEPDVGTTMLLAAVSSVVLLLAGMSWRYFLPPVLAGMIGLGLFLWHDPMRSERIYAWLHPEETKLEKGMQGYQAMVAFGSGGVLGKGLGDGRQKLGFVPEHHTDFILSVIGEELGLIATLGVVLAFLLILISGLYIARNASDTFGLLLGSGITFLIALQAIVNIGVVTGAFPNKGMSLPFISYGGSNLVIMLASVGLMLNIARHAGEREVALEAVPADDELVAESV